MNDINLNFADWEDYAVRAATFRLPNDFPGARGETRQDFSHDCTNAPKVTQVHSSLSFERPQDDRSGMTDGNQVVFDSTQFMRE